MTRVRRCSNPLLDVIIASSWPINSARKFEDVEVMVLQGIAPQRTVMRTGQPFRNLGGLNPVCHG